MTSKYFLLVRLLTVPLLFSAHAEAVKPESQKASSSSAKASAPQREAVVAKPKLDRSGKARRGHASYYGRQFHGKKMASGKPLNPRKSVAASKSLPLGTVARVTNLETGKSEVVTIEDRGPYIKGRIVDVSPKVADKIDLKKEGVAPVEVKPLVVPPRDAARKTDMPDTTSAAK